MAGIHRHTIVMEQLKEVDPDFCEDFSQNAVVFEVILHKQNVDRRLQHNEALNEEAASR